MQRRPDPPRMIEVKEWAAIQHNLIAEKTRIAMATRGRLDPSNNEERDKLARAIAKGKRELFLVRCLLDMLDIMSGR